MKKKNKTKEINQSKPPNHVVVQGSSFVGPIPPPSILEAYGKIIPDAPERILKMAEKNSNHLIELDNNKLSAEKSQIKRGQWLAFGSIIIIVLLCIFALILGYPVVAGLLGSLDLAAIVTAFIFGRLEKPQK